MNRIFSTILVSAVIEFVSDFLPIKESGSARKYLRYITSLIIAISIIIPVWEFFASESAGLPDKAALSKAVSAEFNLPGYIYVTESGVYEANESGEKKGDSELFLDLYIKECVKNISDSVKELLADKLSLGKEDVCVDISLDLTNYEAIEIISIRLRLYGANDFIKRDACDYIRAKLNCKVFAE